MPWIPMMVLPNVSIRMPIEGYNIALASSSDSRVEELKSLHPTFRNLIENFTNEFGRRIEPSIIIIQRNDNRQISASLTATFRDALAISTVSYTRALELLGKHSNGVRYSDFFWDYPWNVDRHYEHIIQTTAIQTSLHEVEQLRPQSNPEIYYAALDSSDFDSPLLEALLNRWRRHHFGRKRLWEDTALFRSLNMANRAAAVPALSDISIYDVGRSMALWVSAFEILAHKGEKSRSDLFTVYDLLRKSPWSLKKIKKRSYIAHKAKDRQQLACWLYGELYKRRNDFLHGNPVTKNVLKLRKSKYLLNQYAAPLYRMALASFLSLDFNSRDMSDVKMFSERTWNKHFQTNYENALITSIQISTTPRRPERSSRAA